MELEFRCENMQVGKFVDLDGYPTSSGKYRYMPYRGPGHLRMQDDCRKFGFARCAYVVPDGQVEFVVKITSDYGVLEAEQFSTTDVKGIE